MVARATNGNQGQIVPWSFEGQRLSTNYNGYDSSKCALKTSNSILSPTKSMVARATNGNQEQIVMKLWRSKTINQL